MFMLELQRVIETYVPFPSRQTPSGWRNIVCAVCHDHGRKGRRAGFKFSESDIGYNCFNCGAVSKYHANAPHLSDNMRTILDAFGVPQSEYNKAAFEDLQASGFTQISSKTSKEHVTQTLKEIPIPSSFYQLTDDTNDEVGQYAIEWLHDTHSMDWKSHILYLSDDKKSEWFGRIILPSFKRNTLVYYQGRDLTDMRKQKYISVSQTVASKASSFHGFDRLHENTDKPLYITESWFDAEHVEGVAVFGRKLYPDVAKVINASRRKKVIIPDKTGLGYELALAGLQHGWSVSLPDINNHKDVSEAITAYGKMYTLMSIRNNIFEGEEAQIKLRLYCSK